MKIWHISDTHCLHDKLTRIPHNADMVIFSGDCSNSRDPAVNANEVLRFLGWFKQLPIRWKVMIGGNHDISINSRLVSEAAICDMGIVYLENNSQIIEGVKIWGSPYSSSYLGRNINSCWAWDVSKGQAKDVWDCAPSDTDIMVTHCPPKGIMDLAFRNSPLELEQCGSGSLLERIGEIEPKLCCFGHIHDSHRLGNSIYNAGLRKLGHGAIIYSNGAVVGNRGELELVNVGNIITI